MCFNQPMSFAFAGSGLLLSWWVWHRSGNGKLASGIFFFFTMELLQGVQYFFIDQCDSKINQVLTILGFLHICCQPYFTHLINSSLTRNPKYLDQYAVILRLCVIGGFCLFLRFVMSPFAYDTNILQPNCGGTHEWLRGDKLCTYSGVRHLAWSVPMSTPTYFSAGVFLHCFLMFAPFFVVKNSGIQGIFLFLTGPLAASYITPNLQEQASIWCFMSIAQIAFMVLFIREKLILGRSKSGSSIMAQNGNGTATVNGKKTK